MKQILTPVAKKKQVQHSNPIDQELHDAFPDSYNDDWFPDNYSFSGSYSSIDAYSIIDNNNSSLLHKKKKRLELNGAQQRQQEEVVVITKNNEDKTTNLIGNDMQSLNSLTKKWMQEAVKELSEKTSNPVAHNSVQSPFMPQNTIAPVQQRTTLGDTITKKEYIELVNASRKPAAPPEEDISDQIFDGSDRLQMYAKATEQRNMFAPSQPLKKPEKESEKLIALSQLPEVREKLRKMPWLADYLLKTIYNHEAREALEEQRKREYYYHSRNTAPVS